MSLALVAPATVFAVSAFPGAEGFGADVTRGGRGGTVYKVTNLNDSGSGSLRACVEASGARTCIFSVGGTINLSSALTIRNPNITIAGQTAPGGGITIRSNGGDVFSTQANNVIMRYISARPGPGGDNHGNQIAKNGTELSNIIIDHSTFSWGVDSTIETWYRATNTIFQWILVSEGLDCDGHSKGCHSKGLMVGGYAAGEGSSSPGSEKISVHHSLFAHNKERAPQIQTGGIVDVVNNVGYNTSGTFSHIDIGKQKAIVPINYIGNYFKAGPESKSGIYGVKIENDGSLGAKIYVSGNLSPRRTADTQPQTDFVDPNAKKYEVSSPNTPNSLSGITTTSAAVAFDKVLSEAGNSRGLNCDGSWFSRRDAIDARIVSDVRNKTGSWIDDPSEVGGWVNIASGTACSDGDSDGIPDAFETANGFNLTSNDANDDKDGDGYTNIEEFLAGNGGAILEVTPTVTPTGGVVPSSTPTRTPTPSRTPTPTQTPMPTPTPTPLPVPGDTDGDRDVDENDFLTIFMNYLTSSANYTWRNGDFTGDHKVDGIDYVIWLINTQ